MMYTYEDLSEDQFEELVVSLCQALFGIAVQGFSKGPDGGRDAKFVGTSELFPSTASPWIGTTIIQAKHTNGHNKYFNQPDFYKPESSFAILSKEVLRVEKLRKSKKIDNYILFANRRLAGNVESNIREYISQKCNLPESSIALCGIETMDLWLKKFSDIPKQLNIDPVDSPLRVSPNELAEVVQALAEQKDKVFAIKDIPPVTRVSIKKKNIINNMSEEYSSAMIKRYLKESKQVQAFLAEPENASLLRAYEEVIEEFQLNIIAKKKDYQSFDEVMNYLIDLLFKRDPILRSNKRLTRMMLFYMYWNCDIGSTKDD